MISKDEINYFFSSMDLIAERPSSYIVKQIQLIENNYSVPMIAAPCPGKTYVTPTIDNCGPLYSNCIIGNPLNINGFYTGWYCYSDYEIESLIHPSLLSPLQCGFCYNCINYTPCMNGAVDTYKDWFNLLSDIRDTELYTTPISSPISSTYSSGRDSPDSDSIWLFH